MLHTRQDKTTFGMTFNIQPSVPNSFALFLLLVTVEQTYHGRFPFSGTVLQFSTNAWTSVPSVRGWLLQFNTYHSPPSCSTLPPPPTHTFSTLEGGVMKTGVAKLEVVHIQISGVKYAYSTIPHHSSILQAGRDRRSAWYSFLLFGGTARSFNLYLSHLMPATPLLPLC